MSGPTPEPTGDLLVWPDDGITCSTCGGPIEPGHRYSLIPSAVFDDGSTTETVVCVFCASQEVA